MNDFEIREVLCQHIDGLGIKVRILDELMIGKARADVVTVTDRLSGYEIKGDSDSYTRLPIQIKEYDRHFQTNYLVVGTSHRKSVDKHVPEYWGIICVCDEDDPKLTFLREPEPNPKFKIKSQLRLLWRRELATILKNNNLPKYAGKSRAFIHGKILERIPQDALIKQICNEFFERDYSQFAKLISF